MSNGNSLTGFKVGKLYICRNPLPMEYDEWWWVLFAGINNWGQLLTGLACELANSF
jgi:hypothetical protein